MFMTLAEGSIAFSDVVVDGIVVEKSRNEPLATAGSLQSICWGSQVGVLFPRLQRFVISLSGKVQDLDCLVSQMLTKRMLTMAGMAA